MSDYKLSNLYDSLSECLEYACHSSVSDTISPFTILLSSDHKTYLEMYSNISASYNDILTTFQNLPG